MKQIIKYSRYKFIFQRIKLFSLRESLMNPLEFSWLFHADKRKERFAMQTTSPSFILTMNRSIDVNWCRPDISKRKSRFVKTVRLEWHSVVRRGMHRHDATQRLISIITRVNLKPLSIIIYATLRLIDESVPRSAMLKSPTIDVSLLYADIINWLIIYRQSHSFKSFFRKTVGISFLRHTFF